MNSWTAGGGVAILIQAHVECAYHQLRWECNVFWRFSHSGYLRYFTVATTSGLVLCPGVLHLAPPYSTPPKSYPSLYHPANPNLASLPIFASKFLIAHSIDLIDHLCATARIMLLCCWSIGCSYLFAFSHSFVIAETTPERNPVRQVVPFVHPWALAPRATGRQLYILA